jgi:uroporphyrinogen-III decarboxylase
MLAAFRGEPVDRVPIWLREGFPLLEGPAHADDFLNGWQAEPLYRELFDYVSPHADTFAPWGIGGFSRLLMVPASATRSNTIEIQPGIRRTVTTIETSGGPLEAVTDRRRGYSTQKVIKHPVSTPEDLRKLEAVPFAVPPELGPVARESYHRAEERWGADHLPWSFISSPLVCISGCMGLELFLEFSVLERQWLHRLLEEMVRRQLAILQAVMGDEHWQTVIDIGGSEQCTPPIMCPSAYDEFIVPYEGRVIGFLKGKGALIQVHCHGKVRHALECMIEEGVDATDPVEPPPAGDVTYGEARQIADGRLTLMGNLEFQELEFSEPIEIRDRIREILSHGSERLILGSSAGPISAVSPRLVSNYKAWIDAALEFGG